MGSCAAEPHAHAWQEEILSFVEVFAQVCVCRVLVYLFVCSRVEQGCRVLSTGGSQGWEMRFFWSLASCLQQYVRTCPPQAGSEGVPHPHLTQAAAWGSSWAVAEPEGQKGGTRSPLILLPSQPARCPTRGCPGWQPRRAGRRRGQVGSEAGSAPRHGTARSHICLPQREGGERGNGCSFRSLSIHLVRRGHRGLAPRSWLCHHASLEGPGLSSARGGKLVLPADLGGEPSLQSTQHPQTRSVPKSLCSAAAPHAARGRSGLWGMLLWSLLLVPLLAPVQNVAESPWKIILCSQDVFPNWNFLSALSHFFRDLPSLFFCNTLFIFLFCGVITTSLFPPNLNFNYPPRWTPEMGDGGTPWTQAQLCRMGACCKVCPWEEVAGTQGCWYNLRLSADRCTVNGLSA